MEYKGLSKRDVIDFSISKPKIDRRKLFKVGKHNIPNIHREDPYLITRRKEKRMYIDYDR